MKSFIGLTSIVSEIFWEGELPKDPSWPLNSKKGLNRIELRDYFGGVSSARRDIDIDLLVEPFLKLSTKNNRDAFNYWNNFRPC